MENISQINQPSPRPKSNNPRGRKPTPKPAPKIIENDNVQGQLKVSSNKKLNNYAFIDCQNLWTNKDKSWHLDWAKFRNYLLSDCQVQRAYLFIGFVSGYQKMYQQMQEAGFILIFKPIQENNGRISCNIDTEMVLQTMIQFNNFDKGVIISGDGDFTCLVDHLRIHDKLEMLILPDHSYSLSLEKCSRDRHVFISELKNRISKDNISPTNHEDLNLMPMIISE
jgi:uncharacterized LabA/DUF88 family protein